MMPSHAVFPSLGGFTGSTLQLPAFGNGGYVDKPTMAIIGETQPEYIVPANKMTNNAPSITVNLTNNASNVTNKDLDQMSRMVTHAVESALIQHQRPGGMFA